MRCNPGFSGNMIPVVARRAVVDHIRGEVGRGGVRPRFVHWSLRDWQKLTEDDVPKSSRVPVDILDDIESRLSPEDVTIFHHMRRGHKNREIAKSLGMSQSTVSRRATDILTKCRAILRDLNG
jgi:DNA-binding NarL/FixJ family response regulator